jgi:hypothetical protein
MAQKSSRKRMVQHLKKRILGVTFLSLFLFILTLQSSIAYFYTIYPECSTEPCITNQPMNWTAEIVNDGSQKIEYYKVEIVDGFTDRVVAEWRVDFRPFSSDRGPVVPLFPRHKVNITMQGFVPAEHSANKFYYYPCFTHINSNTLYLAKYGEYDNRHCYKENESIYVLGCVKNDHCKPNEFCGGNYCEPLQCGDCKYISNHTCVPHECCSDDHCSYNAQCVNNQCYPIACLETQYLFNRTCVGIQCEENEILSNRTCIPIECKENEGYSNHTCVALSCLEDEYLFEHKCAKLECSMQEFISNHTCAQLNCLSSEGYQDHACVPLECPPHKTIENHRCVFKATLLTKYSVEIIALVLIGLFIYLDLYKYKRRGQNAVKSSALKNSGLPSSLEDELNQLKKK